MASSITRFDARIVQSAQDHHAAVPDAVARTLSDLILVYVLFGVVALAVSLHRRSARPALTALVAVLVTEAITYTLKGLIDRSRPPLSHPLIHPLVSLPADASMPSGHASFSAAAAVALGAFSRRLLPVLLALAVLIAVSRVWAGVHYPTDILSGAVLGAMVATACVRIGARRWSSEGRGRQLPAGRVNGGQQRAVEAEG